jgi:hypothetical protein
LKAPGVQPVFPDKDGAISYAQGVLDFAPARLAFSIRAATLNARLHLAKRIVGFGDVSSGIPSRKSRSFPFVGDGEGDCAFLLKR